ncbi:hypothetical protein M2336_002232 [Sphingobium sp. B1D7B]|uniref:hypothetical protein n=2 Tax=unclassified Sphingobium TaxID=2611147 RepID=UPI002224A612|nr:hypothetical protein [Sphingobium sp. B11D3A]MCW2405603.1 hypothetical protein [Sphingobium sp. B1D7B]
MGEQDMMTPEQAAYAYAHWWREAGLDCATDEAPRRWRDGEPVPFWRRSSNTASGAADVAARPAVDAPAEAPGPAPQPAPVQARTPDQAPKRMPGDIPGFLDWIAQDAGQPEADWHGERIALPALHAPRLVLLVEMPAAGATDLAQLLEPQQQRFIASMLGTLGLEPAQAPCLPLALRRPPGGHLDAALLPQLAARISRYLDLVQPGAIILLGDRIGRAMLGERWRPGLVGLEKIDLPHGSVDTVALAGPDLLMNRPLAKARSWQSVRMLHGLLTQ